MNKSPSSVPHGTAPTSTASGCIKIFRRHHRGAFDDIKAWQGHRGFLTTTAAAVDLIHRGLRTVAKDAT